MKQKIRQLQNTNNIVFISLIFLTLLTWAMGQVEIKQNINWNYSFAILLTTAIIKVQIIGDFFMQLRTVCGFWRWIISLWVIFTAALISIAFYL